MILDAAAAVGEVYRSDWGRILASLIRLAGDFDLAEESAQEAFAAAVEQWRTSGIPEIENLISFTGRDNSAAAASIP